MSKSSSGRLVLGLVVSLLSAMHVQAALTDNLQLYSPLDSISAAVAASYWQDVSGNGHHAKANPAAYNGTLDVGGANRGTAIDFVTSITEPQFNSKQITLTDGTNPNLDPGTTDFSFSFWYNQAEAGAGDVGVVRHILNKGNSGSSTPGFCVYTNGGMLTLRSADAVGDGTGNLKLEHLSDIFPVVLANTGWHHVTGVFDRSGTYSPVDSVTMYVDGAAVATGVLPQVNLAPNNISAPTAQVRIGGRDGSDTTRDFEGYMDDMAFYRGALSPTQVQTLYQATTFDQTTVSGPNIAPVFVHNFVTNANIDPVPARVPDVYATPPDVPGTVKGDVTVATDATRGQVISVNVANANNYVDFGDNLDPLTTSYTVSVWVKRDATVTTSQQFASKGNANKGTEGWALGFTAAGLLYARGNHDGAASGTTLLMTTTETAVSADEWHHVALVIDQAAGLWQAYVDGVGSGTDGDNGLWNCDEANYSVTFPTDGSAEFDATQMLRLGRSGSDSATYPFKGQLDDFAIWNRALSASEIQAIFGGAQIVPSAIIPGDATENGTVDAEDAGRVAMYWGATELASGKTWWQMGDFSGNHVIDAADASILAANWGHGVSEGASVPEPSMLLLMAMTLAMVVLRRRIV
jgi:hypothetical protein